MKQDVAFYRQHYLKLFGKTDVIISQIIGYTHTTQTRLLPIKWKWLHVTLFCTQTQIIIRYFMHLYKIELYLVLWSL